MYLKSGWKEDAASLGKDVETLGRKCLADLSGYGVLQQCSFSHVSTSPTSDKGVQSSQTVGPLILHSLVNPVIPSNLLHVSLADLPSLPQLIMINSTSTILSPGLVVSRNTIKNKSKGYRHMIGDHLLHYDRE